MKSKKVVVGIIAAILVVVCMGVAFLATQNDDYYTQIDNRWVQEIAPHGAMNYKYTQMCIRDRFSILWYLCENQGKVVSTEELFEAVWGEKYIDNNNTVMAHIGRLREKMKERAKNPKFIKTVWGVGYTIEK